MSSTFSALDRRGALAGVLLACLASGPVLAQATPTPAPEAVPAAPAPAPQAAPAPAATPAPAPAPADKPAAPKPPAPSGVVVKVNDSVNFRLGLMAQPWADWSQDAASGGYVQNFLIRRARILLGGQVAKKVFFFAETENSRLGRATATTTKNLGTGFSLLDAAVEWRIRKEFNVQAGLIRVPNSREALKGASTNLSLDTSEYTFVASAAMSSPAGRDTGLMLRGWFAGDHLEYRFAGFQGARDAASRQSFRWVGRLQYNLLDTEVYNFPSYVTNSLGTKKIVAIGAAFDVQKNYKGVTADLFVDYPVGPGSVMTTLEYHYLDGGSTFPATLPRSNAFSLEAGYYFKAAKVAAYGRYEQREFTESDAKNEKRYVGGLNYYPFGHNFNIKAGYGRLSPQVGKQVSQFTIQLQVYYF